MKNLSLQWRITIMTAFLIGITCVLMNCFIGYSGKRYMDSIGSKISACGDTQEDNLAVCAELPVLRTLCGADRHDYPGDILQHRVGVNRVRGIRGGAHCGSVQQRTADSGAFHEPSASPSSLTPCTEALMILFASIRAIVNST